MSQATLPLPTNPSGRVTRRARRAISLGCRLGETERLEIVEDRDDVDGYRYESRYRTAVEDAVEELTGRDYDLAWEARNAYVESLRRGRNAELRQWQIRHRRAHRRAALRKGVAR